MQLRELFHKVMSLVLLWVPPSAQCMQGFKSVAARDFHGALCDSQQ